MLNGFVRYQRKREPMRIASYNIRKSVGLDWRRDPNRIIDVLAELNADVVVLQEADKRIGTRAGTLPVERLAKQFGYQFADVSVRQDSHGWHGNAVLYRQPFSIEKTERLVLPSLEPRGAVSVTFAHPQFSNLRIVGTHLALSSTVRVRQVERLKQHIYQTPLPTIVAADFNEWQQHGKLAKGFGPDFDVIVPGRSFHSARPVAALDRFVLYSIPQNRTTGVHRSDLAQKASDHLPVFVDFDLPAHMYSDRPGNKE